MTQDLRREDRRLLFSPGERIIGSALATMLGLAIGLVVLGGAFALGRWMAGLFGLNVAPDTAGLLGALAAMWLFLHRHFDEKLDRMYDGVTEMLSRVYDRDHS